MILFHYIQISKICSLNQNVKNWIKETAQRNSFKIGDINIILCTDDYLLEMNKVHLNHHYYTDIITFNYNTGIKLNGDLYISYDRICSNAADYKVSVDNELLRVVIHGVLHLIGFDDTSNELQTEMTLQENLALENFYTIFHK